MSITYCITREDIVRKIIRVNLRKQTHFFVSNRMIFS